MTEKNLQQDEEMLIVCRKIAAHIIRIRRQMREMADDISQTRDRVIAIEQEIKIWGKES